MYLLCPSSTSEEPLQAVAKPLRAVGPESRSLARTTAAPAEAVQRTPLERDVRAERPNCFKVPGFIHLEITPRYFSLPNVAVVTGSTGQLLDGSHKRGRVAPRRFAARLAV